MSCVPVDLHADWLWSWWGFRRFHNLLDKLAADLVTWQEDICLVPGHTALQTNQVKNGKVTALKMQTKHTLAALVSREAVKFKSNSEFMRKKFFTIKLSNLHRWNLQGVLHQGGCSKNDGLRDEGRLDGSWVEQIGVVAHFAKLH